MILLDKLFCMSNFAKFLPSFLRKRIYNKYVLQRRKVTDMEELAIRSSFFILVYVSKSLYVHRDTVYIETFCLNWIPKY